MKPIQNLIKIERPREKLIDTGAKSLSDTELIAILLGSGTRAKSIHALAREVLSKINSKNHCLSLKDLTSIQGIGTAKGTLVMAALEFSRRRIKPTGIKVRKAKDIIPLFSPWSHQNKEHFIGVTLNGAHEVINIRVISVGLINSTPVHPREVFADAITDRACSIIVAHNHPSGNLEPSKADIEVTESLKKAGEILGIKLLDHIIFAANGYYSFLERCHQ